MLWLIHCVDNPGSTPLRRDNMQTHRAYLASQKDKIVLAGATLSDDGATPTGSCFIVAVETREEAEEFSDGDPFTTAGVFASVNITRVRKGQWNPAVGDAA